MREQIEKSNRRLGDRCDLRDHLASTRSTDIYRAADTSGPALVGMLRYPMRQDARERFAARVDMIRDLDLATPEMVTHGIDGSGRGYVIFKSIERQSILEQSSSVEEGLRRFIETIRIIAALHGEGLVLGDLSENSFLLGPSGQVYLIGLLGNFDVAAEGTTVMPPVETLHFVSPEERSGSEPLLSSDVYALGILGYRLFTGRYLFADDDVKVGTDDADLLASPPSVLRSGLPTWIDDVLGKCLETKAADRFPNAGELLRTIHKAMQDGVSPVKSLRWAQKTLIVHPNTVGKIRESLREDTNVPMTVSEPLGRRSAVASEPTSRTGLVIAIGMFLGGLIAGAAFLLFDGEAPEPTTFETELAIHQGYAPPELKRSLEHLAAPTAPVDSKKEALERIAESDDPVVSTILLSVISGGDEVNIEVREAALQAVVERVRRRGLTRSADVMAKWFETMEKGGYSAGKSPAYSYLIRACDTTFPLAARRTALGKAYEIEPAIALQLAAALSLDERDQSSFAPVLRELVSSELGLSGVGARGVETLILAHSSLSMFFDQDITARLDRLSAPDLGWVLIRLAENDSEFLYPVIDELLKRKVVPPYQAVFLRVIREADKFSLSPSLKKSLVLAARGTITEQSVVEIGSWNAVGAESALLAICAISDDASARLAAFDTLAARTLDGEPSRGLVKWVKSFFWEYREKLVKAIGILGLYEVAGAEQLDYAFEVLRPFAAEGSLVKVMVGSNKDKLITLAIEKFGAETSSREFVELLYHPSPKVRVAGVRALSGRNELGVLQMIYRAYEKERDENVKHVYEEVHWVTRERNRKKP